MKPRKCKIKSVFFCQIHKNIVRDCSDRDECGSRLSQMLSSLINAAFMLKINHSALPHLCGCGGWRIYHTSLSLQVGLGLSVNDSAFLWKG